MLVAVAGVPFLEVTTNFIASGPTPHSACAHLEQATSAITSKHLGIELAELKEADTGRLTTINVKEEAPSTTCKRWSNSGGNGTSEMGAITRRVRAITTRQWRCTGQWAIIGTLVCSSSVFRRNYAGRAKGWRIGMAICDEGC